MTVIPAKALACECGFAATGPDESALVASVRAHALAEHGIDLPADVVLTLVTRRAGTTHPQDTLANGGGTP